MTKKMPSDDKEYLSPEGFKELQERLNDLKTNKRIEIAHRLEYAKSLGDLSENAEYADAKEQQMQNETEIINLEDLLARATVISHVTSTEVRVGSVVSCFKKNNGKTEEQFTIVGREEADPLKGKISNESPLGRAFLGHKKNEKILVSTPRGEVEYHIINIT